MRVGDFELRNEHNEMFGVRWFGYLSVEPKTGYKQRIESVMIDGIDRYGFDKVVGEIEKSDRVNPTEENIL